ncbi:MAG: hypothetical protein ABI780_10330 [Ardenticatenales bacterium]
MTAYDPAEAARTARDAVVERAADAPPPPLAVADPLPYCIYATVALIAWIASPPLAVAVFAAMGLRRYWRAWRAGLDRSSCVLGDPRRVMVYLALLTVAGAGATMWTAVQWWSALR